uniref:DUF4806 domain-containing protein n=1 Tax=Panagrellus redivivus TaxID=6233 RepID=A0A7E4VBL4_PANRE
MKSNGYNLELEMNNLYQGVLHIMLRHFNEFEHRVPGLAAQLSRLPADVKVLMEKYAKCTTQKSKNQVFHDLKTKLSLNKSNKVLFKAQAMLSSYLYSIVHATPTTSTEAKQNRLCLTFELNKKETLKVIASGAIATRTDPLNRKFIRNIVTAYIRSF